MTTPCRTFRTDLLDAVRADSTAVDDDAVRHLRDCSECAAWYERARSQAASLRMLARAKAPEGLEERVRGSLAPAALDARVESALRGLPPAAAPEILRDRVFAPDLDEERPAVRALRELARHRAPAVLERLVTEELADPAKARVERFAGGLERPSAPEALRARLLRRLERSGRTAGLAKLGGALAAAAALVLLLVRGIEPADEGPRPEGPRSYRFELVNASVGSAPPAGSGLAFDLAQGLTGIPLATEEAR